MASACDLSVPSVWMCSDPHRSTADQHMFVPPYHGAHLARCGKAQSSAVRGPAAERPSCSVLRAFRGGGGAGVHHVRCIVHMFGVNVSHLQPRSPRFAPAGACHTRQHVATGTRYRLGWLGLAWAAQTELAPDLLWHWTDSISLHSRQRSLSALAPPGHLNAPQDVQSALAGHFPGRAQVDHILQASASPNAANTCKPAALLKHSCDHPPRRRKGAPAAWRRRSSASLEAPCVHPHCLQGKGPPCTCPAWPCPILAQRSVLHSTGQLRRF